jgi:hypothetical protein
VLQLGFHGSRALTWGTLGVRYTPACKKGHAPYHVHVRHGQQHGAQALQVLLAHGADGAVAQVADAAQLARRRDALRHSRVHRARQRGGGEPRGGGGGAVQAVVQQPGGEHVRVQPQLREYRRELKRVHQRLLAQRGARHAERSPHHALAEGGRVCLLFNGDSGWAQMGRSLLVFRLERAGGYGPACAG